MSFMGYLIFMEGVEMEEQRVSAVRTWPTSNSVKAVQRFLGFANYFRRAIWGFSMVVSYLPAERRSPAASLDGGGGEGVQDAEGTLHHCSRAGTSDPSLPFIVEVDASKVGVGAVPSQHTGTLQSCGFAPSTPSSLAPPRGTTT